MDPHTFWLEAHLRLELFPSVVVSTSESRPDFNGEHKRAGDRAEMERDFPISGSTLSCGDRRVLRPNRTGPWFPPKGMVVATPLGVVGIEWGGFSEPVELILPFEFASAFSGTWRFSRDVP